MSQRERLRNGRGRRTLPRVKSISHLGGGRAGGLAAVARQAGVSLATASRALNGYPRVRPEVRAAVETAASDLGYRPDPLARSLRTGATMTVGALIGTLVNPISAAIMTAAADTLAANGYLTIMAQQARTAAAEPSLVATLSRYRVDALLWHVADETNPQVRRALQNLAIPTVLVDRRVDGVPADSVVADHYGGLSSAMALLVDAGHRSIAILPGPLCQWPGRQRLAAYRAALAAHDLREHPEWVVESPATQPAGYAAARQLLAATPRPTAVVTGGNRVTVGALQAIRDLGLRIPADLSLVSCAAPELSEYFTPPLARIALPLAEMGEAAADLLVTRLTGTLTGPPREITLPVQFTSGESIGPPPTRRLEREEDHD